jgi:hypothetical protein
MNSPLRWHFGNDRGMDKFQATRVRCWFSAEIIAVTFGASRILADIHA